MNARSPLTPILAARLSVNLERFSVSELATLNGVGRKRMLRWAHMLNYKVGPGRRATMPGIAKVRTVKPQRKPVASVSAGNVRVERMMDLSRRAG